MEFGRREFLGALAAASAVSGCTTGGARVGSENVSVFLSDLHVEGAQPAYKYSKARLEKTVDEILAMSQRPGRVVCFGDIACSYGLESDYVEAKRILSRLENAGIPVREAPWKKRQQPLRRRFRRKRRKCRRQRKSSN